MDKEIWQLLDSRGMGGIESHVAELASGLQERGECPRVVFLADHGPHPLHERLAGSGIPWEALPGGFLALRRRLLEARPKVLHTHGYKSGLLGRAAGLTAGVSVVSSFHAGERPKGIVAVYDMADRWTSFTARRIAVSERIRRRIPFGAVLVENFVGIPVENPQRHGPNTVAFVGRMSHEKGPDQFCRLAIAVQGPRFTAYGDGPERVTCEALGVGRVDFLGAVASMADYWRDVGLLAITSRAEGLPLAALEAMAHGVPVASFAVGGLPGAIEDGVDGFLAPEGDLEALADKVRRWASMDSASRLAMARAARSKAERRFGRPFGTNQVLSVYAGLRRPG